MAAELTPGMEAQYEAIGQFLSGELTDPASRKLDFAPDLRTLQMLLDTKAQSGIVNYGENNWHLVRGAYDNPPPLHYMPARAEVLIATDPTRPTELTLPFAEEFANASPTAKNLLVSHGGITRYWNLIDRRYETPSRKPVHVDDHVSRISRSTDPNAMAEYRSILAGEDEHRMISGRYTYLPWEAITEPVVTAIIQM